MLLMIRKIMITDKYVGINATEEEKILDISPFSLVNETKRKHQYDKHLQCERQSEGARIRNINKYGEDEKRLNCKVMERSDRHNEMHRRHERRHEYKEEHQRKRHYYDIREKYISKYKINVPLNVHITSPETPLNVQDD